MFSFGKSPSLHCCAMNSLFTDFPFLLDEEEKLDDRASELKRKQRLNRRVFGQRVIESLESCIREKENEIVLKAPSTRNSKGLIRFTKEKVKRAKRKNSKENDGAEQDNLSEDLSLSILSKINEIHSMMGGKTTQDRRLAPSFTSKKVPLSFKEEKKRNSETPFSGKTGGSSQFFRIQSNHLLSFENKPTVLRSMDQRSSLGHKEASIFNSNSNDGRTQSIFDGIKKESLGVFKMIQNEKVKETITQNPKRKEWRRFEELEKQPRHQQFSVKLL